MALNLNLDVKEISLNESVTEKNMLTILHSLKKRYINADRFSMTRTFSYTSVSQKARDLFAHFFRLHIEQNFGKCPLSHTQSKTFTIFVSSMELTAFTQLCVKYTRKSLG